MSIDEKFFVSLWIWSLAAVIVFFTASPAGWIVMLLANLGMWKYRH